MNPLIPALIEGLLDTILSHGGAPGPDAPASPIVMPAGVLRTIPPGAQKATMNPLQQGMVQMDNEPMRLSPGSQIRDQHNRILLPLMVQQPVTVRYTKDPYGNVHHVWILTQAEAEQPVPEQ